MELGRAHAELLATVVMQGSSTMPESRTATLRKLFYESSAHRRLFALRSERPELAMQVDAIAGSLLELLEAAATFLHDD